MIKLTDLDVYSLSETLSDIIWNEYVVGTKKPKIRSVTKLYDQATVLQQILQRDTVGSQRLTGKNFIFTPEVLLKKPNVG